MDGSENVLHYLEVVTPDAENICELYEKSYGWQFEQGVTELGNAFVAEMPGGGLFGIRAPMQPQEQPTVRTYIRVADLKAAVRRASDAGAEVMLEEMEIPGRGKIAIFLLGGIEQGVWQVP